MIPVVERMVLGAVTGLCSGSYVSTAALRAVQEEQSTTGRSRCDRCSIKLGYAETIPVVSFLIQRGVCRRCGTRIEPLHLVGELWGGVLMAVAFSMNSPLVATTVSILGLILLASSVVDIKTHRLPDALTGLAFLLCAALSALASWDRFGRGVIAAVGVGVVLLGVRWVLFKFTGRQSLGLGDVKLATVLALWLGDAVAWAIAGAAAVGLLALAILRPSDGRLAFGPALAASCLCVGLARELLL